MRASRLISILTTLQAKGRVTAPALAEACEVSVRTIYRDIDALSEAGVPVYSERGPDGGYRLLDGYRTRLNGLSRAEAEALFLTGLSGPAAELGLGTILATAELKLLAALPADLRESATAIRARFHLDASDWFEDLERPPALQALADAVWRRASVVMRYRRGESASERRVDPLGLVLKGGAWYLAAARDGEVLTWRVGRIVSLTVLDETFSPPAGFDLAAYWEANSQSFEEGLYRQTATVRLSPRAMARLGRLGRVRARVAAESASAPDADGWRVARLPMESVREGAAALMGLGAEAEVLAPPELRRVLADTAAAMNALYEADQG